MNDFEAILATAATEPPSVDSAAWSALQDYLQERGDVRWVAVSFVRRTQWAPMKTSGSGPMIYAPTFSRRVDVYGPEVSNHVPVVRLPGWWSRHLSSLAEDWSVMAEAYGAMLRAFALAHAMGEVPAAFLFAHGAPCPPGPVGKWVVTHPAGNEVVHGIAVGLARELADAGDPCVLVVPDDVRVAFVSGGVGPAAVVETEADDGDGVGYGNFNEERTIFDAANLHVSLHTARFPDESHGGDAGAEHPGYSRVRITRDGGQWVAVEETGAVTPDPGQEEDASPYGKSS